MPQFYNNYGRNYSNNNNYRGNIRYSNVRGNFNNVNQQNMYDARNRNIRVLQHSGNEMPPPTTAQEEIVTQIGEMSIH